jgi:signal transduction histidine kinase
MLHLDWRFFPVFDSLDPTTAYHGSYDLGLVAISLAIAILAALVALSISGRITAAASSRARWAWATAGAICMGGGIWSMHFIGMLSFSLPCGIAYDPVGTVLSMIPGMIASGIALGTISRPRAPGLGRLAVSAVLMGAGIGAMHYSGMAAMLPEALLRYDPGLVGLSVAVAVVLAFVSLSIRFSFVQLGTPPLPATVIAATVMGCAVAGMHYTAMQASIFFPLADAPFHSMALSPTLLALLIAIFTVLIAASTLVATFAGRQNELALVLTAEVTRRKRTEEDLVHAREQAEAASQAKSQFLATMSHELRTPLNAVIGYSELLLDDAEADSREEQLIGDLRRINGAGKHLLSLVTDVLDLSKIEAGKMELAVEPFDLDSLIDDVVVTCRPLVMQNGSELVIDRDAELGTVIGDQTKLRQVVLNLVSNAAKFTQQGRVSLAPVRERTAAGDWISIAVRDTGIGISRENLSKLFQNFSQVETVPGHHPAGTGLGLALSQKLCRLMGGQITVESLPGRGSCFTVRLPAQPLAA